MPGHRPIVCIDFDSTIHLYSRGWQDGSIYDDVVPGFFAWAARAKDHLRLVIYSSRSKTEEGRDAMKVWLAHQLSLWIENGWNGGATIGMDNFEFAHEKPPAFLTIDDRAVTFMGDWNDPRISVESILAFKPWNAGPQPLGDHDGIKAIVTALSRHLVGLRPEIQGAALADLLAMWLAGHHIKGDEHATRELRAKLLAMHCHTVRELFPVNARAIGTTQ